MATHYEVDYTVDDREFSTGALTLEDAEEFAHWWTEGKENYTATIYVVTRTVLNDQS